MVEIVLVRHAQPNWEPNGKAVNDPCLTDYGQQQAIQLASALEGKEFDAFYVSPLVRARETAAPVAEVLGRQPKVLSWLEEIRLPDLEGSPADEVKHMLEEAQARDLMDWWEGLPGGETFRHFNERVCGGFEDLLSNQHRARIHDRGVYSVWDLPEGEQRILIVCHLGTISVSVSHLLGLEPVPWAWERFAMDWAGITIVRSVPLAGRAIWALKAFNQVHHLQ
ncbi:MAG: histidine phosphatase family protein [Vulcanimicrobiota bacterium]